jgi:tetratricopeptide (TPR) repeat protein
VCADAVDNAAKLYQEGKDADALERIESYLVEHPNDPRGRFLKAQLLSQKGATDQAIGVYTSIIEEYPELAEPYNNLAVIYAQQGRYELARRYLEQAVQAFPEYSVALENLGDVYVKLAEGAYGDAAQYDKSSSALKTKLTALGQLLPDKPQAPVFRTPLPPKVVPAKKQKGTNPVTAPAPQSSR